MKKETKTFIWVGLMVAIFLAAVISPLASSWPDGLEKVAKDTGFLAKGEGWTLWKSALIPDYIWPGLGKSPLATAAAGLAGVVAVLAASCSLAYLIKRGRKPKVSKNTVSKT